MELCTGGSLYDVIDSPENAYGLSEAEFKQVIYDVGKYIHTPIVSVPFAIIDKRVQCVIVIMSKFEVFVIPDSIDPCPFCSVSKHGSLLVRISNNGIKMNGCRILQC